jgi:hypothetical protein
MTDTTEGKLESREMLIFIHHENGHTRFWKPEGEYYKGYAVKHGGTSKAAIHVDEGNAFPVYLRFAANLPILAVGFAETGPVLGFRGEGPCGGCFRLLAGFDHELDPQKTPLIRNNGDNPASGFRFKLWFRGDDGHEHEIPIDPQIYNQGDTEPPGSEG